MAKFRTGYYRFKKKRQFAGSRSPIGAEAYARTVAKKTVTGRSADGSQGILEANPPGLRALHKIGNVRYFGQWVTSAIERNRTQ